MLERQMRVGVQLTMAKQDEIHFALREIVIAEFVAG
jgi:hypothetical protein